MKKLLLILVALVVAFSTACTPISNYDPDIVPITIAEALELCNEAGTDSTERYYIEATVDSVTNPTYGAMVISDETGSISVYNSTNADGSVGYADMEDKPYKGDSVLLSCILQNFNGNKEIKQARIISFEHAKLDIDENEYTQMTIAQARSAEKGAKVKVSGVVSAITYANGYKPSGVYLIDETSSIYVYDADLAGRVKKGDNVTLVASKTYWVLESEQANAEKFGYKGCNQLEGATLISINGTNQEFNKDWIVETTVKEMLSFPITADVTTLVYKVNALVSKSEGTGFVNYYFNDLDGTTGTYTYTQCNGGDFAWLDQFDGKICTVYLSILNAKSTATGCVFRFLPVAVYDEGFVFDPANAPKYAVQYHGVGQFESLYKADPALELITNVSSELLGFSGVEITYSSSNSAIADFELSAGKAIMHLKDYGTVEITVTATYMGVNYSEKVTVTHEEGVQVTSITVAQALVAELESEVTVKGIVGPSLVNQSGFYLFGEDGSVIAVLMSNKADIPTLAIGNEVVLKGIRTRKVKDGSTEFGQTNIKECTIVQNNYGTHALPESKIITDKTLAELAEVDVTADFSTNIYRVKATIAVAQYAASLTAGEASITMYTSSKTQYAWIYEAYPNTELTFDIALCNWNCKGYKVCVLAVYTPDGARLYNTLNFNA